MGIKKLEAETTFRLCQLELCVASVPPLPKSQGAGTTSKTSKSALLTL